MFSLGCVQSTRCHTDTCTTGVATQSPARQRALVIPEKAERVARFQRSTLDALHDIVVACGLDTPDQFIPDGLRQRVSAVEMRPMDEIYAFIELGE
jgi:glutamate synthase domain-containing protein 2